MIRTALTVLSVSAGVAVIAGQLEAGPLDRIEDRIDRRESIRDERVDHGPRDVIEDRIDRIESRLDRAGFEHTPRIDRHERRSWRRWWATAN